MTTVKEVQEEVLTIATGLSQLILHSHSWKQNQDSDTEGLSSALYSIIKIWSVLGLPAVDVLVSKLAINKRAYPKTSCQEGTTIQDSTKYTAHTGIKKYFDVLLFKDINARMIPLEGFHAYARVLYERNKTDFNSHFASLMQQVTTSATERNWISNYTNESISLSLLSELGQLASVLQWTPQNIMLNNITVHQKNSLARTLADVVIYLVHLCRTRNLTPVLSGEDAKKRTLAVQHRDLNHRGIALPPTLDSNHLETPLPAPVQKRLRHKG
jgi:hypothetical protein